MATSPEVVREELAAVTAAASADLAAQAAAASSAQALDSLLETLPLIVPPYYDAAGLLAVAWYDEIREESAPLTAYVPDVIGDPSTDWIEREIAKLQRSVEADIEEQMQRLVDETMRLAEKEVARGFRESIVGNTRQDEDAIGWSRVARPSACKFCLMLAAKGAVFSKETAIFAAHTDCHCAARPEFRGGTHGPEASVVQYVASSRRAKTEAAQAARNERLRAYLNQHYPDAPG